MAELRLVGVDDAKPPEIPLIRYEVPGRGGKSQVVEMPPTVVILRYADGETRGTVSPGATTTIDLPGPCPF